MEKSTPMRAARYVYRRARQSRETLRVVALLDADLVADIDQWGMKRGATNRSEALRSLIRHSIDAEKATGPALESSPVASEQ